MNWKPMKITKSGHKKVKLLNEKHKRKINEGNLQSHGMVEKVTEKLMNQIWRIKMW